MYSVISTVYHSYGAPVPITLKTQCKKDEKVLGWNLVFFMFFDPPTHPFWPGQTWVVWWRWMVPRTVLNVFSIFRMCMCVWTSTKMHGGGALPLPLGPTGPILPFLEFQVWVKIDMSLVQKTGKHLKTTKISKKRFFPISGLWLCVWVILGILHVQCHQCCVP